MNFAMNAVDFSNVNLRRVRAYKERGHDTPQTWVEMDNGDEHTLAGHRGNDIERTQATVIPADSGYVLLEAYVHGSDGVSLYENPIVAWEVVPGSGPRPVALGMIYEDYAENLAVRLPDGRVVWSPDFEPEMFADQSEWIARLKANEEEKQAREAAKAACPTPPCERSAA